MTTPTIKKETSKMIRVGVIGLGAIGREHLAMYRRLPNVEVTAVADFQLDIAKDLAAGAAAFSSASELVASGLVDAVSLCTPDHLHYSDALTIIDAGVHLLLEKPIATTVEEAEELVRVAEGSGLVVMPGHTLRFLDRYIAAKSIVASGAIGDPVHGYARRNNMKSVAARVQGRTSVTFFLGVHDIDAVSWITGQPIVAVQAMKTEQLTADGTQSVAVMGSLRLGNGGVIQLEAAWGLPDDFPTEIDARLRVVGSKGEVAIDIHDQGMRAFSDRLTYPVPAAYDAYGLAEGPLSTELASFVQSVETDSAPPITMSEAAAAVRVAAAIDRATESGATETV